MNLQRQAGNAAVARIVAVKSRVQPVQRSGDGETTSVEGLRCGVRTVELPVPGGTPAAVVVLKDGPTVPLGILFIRNVGECAIGLNGDVHGVGSTRLEPGEYLYSYVPPAGSSVVRAAAWADTTGRAAVEYDPCTGTV